MFFDCSGSLCRKPSIVSKIVLWATAICPSFTSRWAIAFLNANCAWVICKSHCMSPQAQKSADCLRFARWICCALCSTLSAHSQPSRKQSQPRQSWYRASTPNLEFGFSSKVSVCVPPESSYCLNKCTTLPSVCWSYSHWTSCPTKSLSVRARPGLRNQMMWDVDLSWHLQLGHAFRTKLSMPMRDSCQLVPWKCETCFVTQTRNISENNFSTCSMPSK